MVITLLYIKSKLAGVGNIVSHSRHSFHIMGDIMANKIKEFEQEKFKKWVRGLNKESIQNYRNGMKLYMKFTIL